MLTYEEVQEVAKLARITLSDQEIQTFQTDLSKVLVFFTELQSLDTEHEKEIGHITGRENEARTDTLVETPKAVKEQIVKNFPEEEEGFLKVKSVL